MHAALSQKDRWTRKSLSACLEKHQGNSSLLSSLGLPGSWAGKESACSAGDTGLIPGSGRSAGEGIGYPLQCSWASLVAQLVKNLPAMQETWVWSLGWEDPLEKGTATHSKESDTTEWLSLSLGEGEERMMQLWWQWWSFVFCSVAKPWDSMWPPWTVALQAPLLFTISWSLLRFIAVESGMLSNHFILSFPLLLLP